MARGPSKAPEGETKAARFLRTAPDKMNKALNGIAGLNSLATSEYTADHLATMRTAINAQLEKTFNYLANPKGSNGDGFKF